MSWCLIKNSIVFRAWCLVKHRIRRVVVHVFIAWSLVKHRDKFNFTFTCPC